MNTELTLPFDICLEIWNYVGNNAIYLNKDLLKYIKELKAQFKENPLELEYRLVQWKEMRSVHSYDSYRRHRPSMLVQKKRIFLLSGQIPLGTFCYRTNHRIIPSQKIRDMLIPLSTIRETNSLTRWRYKTTTIYWEIYDMFCYDDRRAKQYKLLFN